jgi:hypothetical protein
MLLIKRLFFVVLIAMVFSVYNSVFAEDNDQVVYWPGSISFKTIVKSFSVSVEDAHKSLVAKTREHPHRFFDKTPIFIVGDEYFFAEPLKDKISLQGFYVNGMTGKIEYRKSNYSIKSKQKKISKDVYLERVEMNDSETPIN